MLSRIDDFIYPNRCEVIEIGPQRYFYPIFKNGSSSITETYPKRLLNNQIKKCGSIDIILRNPTERFVSGVNTFVYKLLQENNNLDKSTVLYFVENYLFLNRHYAPQISWLVQLNRYASPDCVYNFKGMEALIEYTDLHIQPIEEQVLTEYDVSRLKTNIHNEIYKTIDAYLLELVGSSMTFNEVLEYIKSRDKVAYSKCTAHV